MPDFCSLLFSALLHFSLLLFYCSTILCYLLFSALLVFNCSSTAHLLLFCCSSTVLVLLLFFTILLFYTLLSLPLYTYINVHYLVNLPVILAKICKKITEKMNPTAKKRTTNGSTLKP